MKKKTNSNDVALIGSANMIIEENQKNDIYMIDYDDVMKSIGVLTVTRKKAREIIADYINRNLGDLKNV